MAKRKAESVPALGHLALEATLDTDEGLTAALSYLHRSADTNFRKRLAQCGMVVAKRADIEKLMQDSQDLPSHGSGKMDEAKMAHIVQNLSIVIAQYDKLGFSMSMAEKKRRFVAACVATSSHGYYNNQRYNLRDGKCHVGSTDTHMPDPECLESWYTYYAGPEGCHWARRFLTILGLEEEAAFVVHTNARIVSVKWAAEDDKADSDDE